MYREAYLRNVAAKAYEASGTLEKAIILENIRTNEWSSFTGDEFDIFLSHSYMDKEVIYGIYMDLRNRFGYSVYVDWIVDRQLDRTKVSKRTAEKLKGRMMQSKCLFYATSNNATKSRWMPWELGYLDGEKGKAVILPVLERMDSSFNRDGYLEVYPYVNVAPRKSDSKPVLWICENDRDYVQFDNWLK